MSIVSTIKTDLTKAFAFLSVILTKTSAVDATFTKLAPQTKAAILATFYDASKTIGSAAGAVEDAVQGNIPGAITLSEATVAMTQTVITDFKGDLTVLGNIVTALKADVS
ncbi:hypothetical protein [Pseudomonas sp.]|uniref:hypothetical protein n=1 Tax=Pseudomonas sp. TaxID=306 RepID=UPI00261542D0|nr:hypothetical protein [Pseudomonas sp.]